MRDAGDPSLRIGVDLGGTKIEAVAIDRAGAELIRRRVSTPAGDYTGTVAAVRDLVYDLESELERKGTVGVATPGAISPATSLMKNANSVCLNGRDLGRDLSAALGREVRMANDANCFALSEAVDGAGRGAVSVFGVILGTGVGGGVVVAGRALAGPNAVAGEWGHNPLPWPRDDERPGPSCYCGRSGCNETFLSGPAMARDHLRVRSEALSAPEIAARAEAGDDGARATLARYEDRLARGLAAVVNVLDPEVIVLGGGVSRIARLYDRVPSLMAPYVFSGHVSTRLLPAVHGDASGVRGAAWLWPTCA